MTDLSFTLGLTKKQTSPLLDITGSETFGSSPTERKETLVKSFYTDFKLYGGDPLFKLLKLMTNNSNIHSHAVICARQTEWVRIYLKS